MREPPLLLLLLLLLSKLAINKVFVMLDEDEVEAEAEADESVDFGAKVDKIKASAIGSFVKNDRS